MKSIAEFVISLFQGLKLTAKWAAFIGLVGIFIFGLSTYEKISGQFYFSKLEKKIELLEKLNNLALSGIADNNQLYPIFNTLVENLETYEISQQILPGFPKINLGNPIVFGKAISGAFFGY